MKTSNNPTIVSGVRPPATCISGTIFGAVKNAIRLQEAHDAFLFIADLHAITEPFDPRELARLTMSTAALYLACGLDESRASLFVQSHVPAHAQLARLLGSVAPDGMLRRMIQYKEKAVKQGQDACLGLLDYPVLMAADILLYDADLVPVGADQKQHLELTRELAERFNRAYGEGLLKLPAPLVVAETARVMSLTDGTKKMSKSDQDDASRINLMDSPDVIRAKLKRAKTDSIRGMEFDNSSRPEVHNLLSLYQVLSGKTRDEVQAQCANMGYGVFKPLLAGAIVNELAPIQERYRALMGDEAELRAILARGAEKASAVAAVTLTRASKAMGFLM